MSKPRKVERNKGREVNRKYKPQLLAKKLAFIAQTALLVKISRQGMNHGFLS